MPAKRKIDHEKLIKAVESGKHQSEIIKEFKFNNATQLKCYYLDALMDAGIATALVNGRESSESSTEKMASVSKRGSVAIAKDLITDMGFAEGDKFEVHKTNAGISLTKID